MATIPSPETGARYILRIFVRDFNCRPTHILTFTSIHVKFLIGNFAPADFNPAMQYAQDHGWIETTNRDGTYRLTEAGYAAA